MNKNFTYFSLLALFLTLLACENTDYLIYNAGETNRIFFNGDTVRFTYGLTMDKNIDTVAKVNLIGLVNQTTEAPFKIAVNSELSNAIAGKHYNVPETNFFVKDSATARIKLDFIKSNLEKNKDYTLVLDLIENESFKPTDLTRCVIIFGDKDIKAPKWWQSGKVGAYSQEKLILFVDLFSKTKESSPMIYQKIVKVWGVNLDGGKPTDTNLLTIAAYQAYLKRYILNPMYEYYLQTNDPIFEIPKP